MPVDQLDPAPAELPAVLNVRQGEATEQPEGGTEQPATEGGTEQPATEGGTEQPEGGTEQPATEGGTEQPEGGTEQPASMSLSSYRLRTQGLSARRDDQQKNAEDGDGPALTDEHVQCTFHVQGQRVGAVYDLPATLTAGQVAEVMTAAAQEMFGDGRAIGLQVAGRPFSKVLGELARNREATYEITALWCCPRALLQTLEEAEATFSSEIDPYERKNNYPKDSRRCDWDDKYICTPVEQIVELIMANPGCQSDWEEGLRKHGAERRAFQMRMPAMARDVLARAVGTSHVDRYSGSAVYRQLVTGGVFYPPGQPYQSFSTGFERAIRLGELQERRETLVDQVEKERAEWGYACPGNETHLAEIDRMIRVHLGKLDRRVAHGLRVELTMRRIQKRHFNDNDEYMITEIATALLGRLPPQCRPSVETLKASDRLDIDRWRAKYEAMSDERLRLEPNRWGVQQLPLDIRPDATRDQLLRMHIAKEVFDVMDSQTAKVLDTYIEDQTSRMQQELQSIQKRVTRQDSDCFDLKRAIHREEAGVIDYPVHLYARLSVMAMCADAAGDDVLFTALRERQRQVINLPLCRGRYRGLQCELSDIIFTKQRIFPNWFQCKNMFIWEECRKKDSWGRSFESVEAVKAECPGCPLSEYSLTDPDVAEHLKRAALKTYSAFRCTCDDYASLLKMEYTAHHKRMCELNYFQYLLLRRCPGRHTRIGNYLERAVAAPAFWSHRGERVAFQVRGMHAYLTSKDASVLNVTIKELARKQTFTVHSVEQWTDLTRSYDTGAVSHDAFQSFLAKTKEQYDLLLEKVPPAAMPGAAVAKAPCPLHGTYSGSHCEVCKTPFQGNQDRKREQRQFHFFRVMLGSCSDREEHLETRRVKNKAQTVGETTYVLSGLADALKRPPQTATIEATIEAVNGPMSWAAFLERDTQVRCGVCCPDCWYRFCVEK
eukprot:COSAG01_NODE_500_length_16223_cov_42.586988_5_plen_945_part_00